MRDFIGYANRRPKFRWPGNAGLAINFVLNYEEGSEYSIDDRDGRSEAALLEVNQPRVPIGSRDLAAESMYEYGRRVGFWRLHDLFRERDLPLTIFASALALERNPGVAAAIRDAVCDLVAHGHRWVEHYRLDEQAEGEAIAAAYRSSEQSVGRPPAGWYCRYSPSEATRRLLVAHGGYRYDSDAYNDELPFWVEVDGKPHLVVPYSLVTNDAKFLSGGSSTGRDFADFLIDSFDVLAREGAKAPRMLSVGMHARVAGHPGRISGLETFLDHIAGKPGVWVAGRSAIADFWHDQQPFVPAAQTGAGR